MRLVYFLMMSLVWSACDTEPKISADVAKSLVEKWSAQVEGELQKQAGGKVAAKEIEAVFVASADAEKTKGSEPPYALWIHDVYSEREFQPAFVERGKLSKQGVIAWDLLKNIENHALDPSGFHIAEITKSLEDIENLGAGSKEESLKPTSAEIEEVTKWVMTQSATSLPIDESGFPKLSEHLLASESGQRIQPAIEALQSLSEKIGKKSATLEANLAIDLAKFTYLSRFSKDRKIFLHPRQDDKYYSLGKVKKRPDDARGKLRGGFVWRKSRAIAEGKSDPKELRYEGARALLTDMVSNDKYEKAFQTLFFAHPQYTKLVNAFSKYKEIVNAGGWEKIEPVKGLAKGAKGPVVTALKTRLQVESFYPKGEIKNDTFDDVLVSAVKDYQETHQMKITGKAHKTFWKSLNIPAKRRHNQIAKNLKRMRETNIRHGDDPYYVYVNVPDFHAEVWDAQERKMRFRVVVGNNKLVFDEKTKKTERANRTPTPFAAMIDRVIYNPYWNVTERVRTGEIVKKVNKALKEEYEAEKAKALAEGKDPSTVPNPYLNKETGEIDATKTQRGNVPKWYAQHGYEVVGAGRGYEYVRQIPGGGNALGKVKVIFPNLYDVYLHDTPKKRLFKEPIRAFSHGCMRMHHPLDFAEFILRHDGQYDASDVPMILKKRKPTPIFLKKMVPVFVEYYTVRVDDKERVHFLADIYSYDKEKAAK